MSPLTDNSTTARYWRSLDELAQAPELIAQMQDEFPDADSSELKDLSRRQFTQMMAASMALAGITVSGCRRWPEQQVRPLAARTEGFLPGVAEYFATQFELGGVATGILAKSVDGRPIKIEGNEQHPFSLGSAGVFAQASVLELYDPQRSRSYVYRSSNGASRSKPAGVDETANPVRQTRQQFETVMAAHFASLKQRQGAGVHFLSQSCSSPTLNSLRQQVQSTFPKSSWHHYDPIDRDNEIAGSKLAFGQAVRCQYHLDRARTIVCLDADILGLHPGHQRWCGQWAAGREPNAKTFSQLFAVESAYSVTGAAADVRYPLRPLDIGVLVEYVASRLGLKEEAVEINATVRSYADTLFDKLVSASNLGLVIGGPSLAPEVHAWIHAINHHLGSFDQTISFTEETLDEAKSSVESLATLCGALRGGLVDTLVILDGNPIYDAPADLRLELFSPRPDRRLISLHLALYDNETSRQCTWHIPAAHYLESWGDGRAWDGTYGIRQPLIQPLYEGMSSIELLSLINGQTVRNGHDQVRGTANSLFDVEDEIQWQTLLHDGVLANSQYPTVQVPAPATPKSVHQSEVSGLQVRFTPDSKIYDGRFANNGWLQELPDSLTKLAWGNAALISKSDADQLQLSDGDEIAIELNSEIELRSVPVLIQPGHAVGCVTVPLGYGKSIGHIAQDVGVNAFTIRTSDHRFVVSGARINKLGRGQRLAVTQEHHLIDPVGMAGHQYRVGRPREPGTLVRETTLTQHQRDPHAVHQPFHEPQAAPMFNPPHSFNTPHSWGMAIDLNRCIGCNACVVACQAENNIPIVGKANVIQNREMHWIRVDRYFKGEPDAPSVVHVPVACAQCEDAPCEQVCPVAATVHDSEGLNAMVYNRCVGTRYCANNCPYKVRRFNYFDFHASDPKAPARPWLDVPDEQTPEETSKIKQLVFNPDVSVRMRGVMEKCTYCVQRISQARHTAKLGEANGHRESAIIADGEMMTACQQTCPTQAISFGDLNDNNSQVSKAQKDSRAYDMLGELNIKPRTRYLARIRNVEPPATH